MCDWMNLNDRQIKQTNWTVPAGTQTTIGTFSFPPVETGGYDILRTYGTLDAK